jgi:hypothetical protein
MIVEISDMPAQFKLHEVRCFDAVVRLGSFQAAAETLGRTHPSVFAAVSKLEERLSLVLLDRGGYRVTLTEAGRMFHARAVISLREMDKLGAYARQLAQGEEPVIRVVLGDLCPRSLVLPILSSFACAMGVPTSPFIDPTIPMRVSSRSCSARLISFRWPRRVSCLSKPSP